MGVRSALRLILVLTLATATAAPCLAMVHPGRATVHDGHGLLDGSPNAPMRFLPEQQTAEVPVPPRELCHFPPIVSPRHDPSHDVFGLYAHGARTGGDQHLRTTLVALHCLLTA